LSSFPLSLVRSPATAAGERPAAPDRLIGRGFAGLERLRHFSSRTTVHSPASSRLASLAALSLCLAAGPLFAKPKIELSIAQAKEVVEVKGGVKTARLVPVKAAAPGDVLEYTLTYTNSGDEVARDAAIDDPVPKGSSYLAGTAAGEGAEITFSTDGGKTYAPAVKLTYELRAANGQVEKRTATPGDYTHVRWTVKSIPPGASGKVSFRVRVN
jgi:uncharacterized repeat protein (TIGR01451 family)